MEKGERMKLKACAAAIICAAVVFSVHGKTSKAQEVDAITEATLHGECQFTLPFKVTATTITVDWNEQYAPDGTPTISYGTSKTNLTTRAVTVSERTAMKLTLTGLKANTSYFILYEVSMVDMGAYGDTTTVKTSGTIGALRNFAGATNMPLELLDHSVQLGSKALAGDRLIISDCEGRMLFNYSVKGSEGKVNSPSLSKGIYFFTVIRQGKLLENRRVVIVNK
jgi:hypothetical protein